MKKDLFTLSFCILFYSTLSYTQNLNSDLIDDNLYEKTFNAFSSGELLEYKLYYGFLNASYASLELRKEELNNKTIRRIYNRGKRKGYVSP